MRKTGRILFLGLLVLFLASAGSALANKPVVLSGTTWTGSDITLVTAGNPGAASTTNSFSITFAQATGTTDTDLLGGQFTPPGGSATNFSAVQNGNFVSIVAPNFIIHARVETVWSHKTSTTTMHIRGKSLTDGSQFFGTLTE